MNSEEHTVLSVKDKLLLVIPALIGTGIILLSTSRYGAGLSPDSVEYIAIARHIASGVGFVGYDGTPLVLVPPLYPMLLATIQYTLGIDPLSSAHIVNALLFGLIVYLSGLIAFRHLTSSPAFALLGIISVLVSKPLFEVSVMAWSEPLFVIFIVLFFINMESYLSKRDKSSLIVIALMGALASLTRYIGVTVILTGILVVLFFHRGSLKTKMSHLFVFILISTIPLGIWAIRNWAISGALFGARASSQFTLWQNMAFTLKTILSWYLPIIELHKLFYASLNIAIGSLVFLNFKSKWAKEKVFLSQVNQFILFIAVYTAFLIITSTTTYYDRINSRLLSPVYVPLTLFLLKLAENVVEPFRGQRFSQKTVNALLVIGVTLWLFYPSVANIYQGVKFVNQGTGEYSSKTWRDSETIQYIRQHALEDGYEVYSNASDALYILANLKAKRSPVKGMDNSLERIDEISILGGCWPEEDKTYLVWFNNKKRPYLFTIDELRATIKMIKIAQFDDGVIYFISK